MASSSSKKADTVDQAQVLKELLMNQSLTPLITITRKRKQ